MQTSTLPRIWFPTNTTCRSAPSLQYLRSPKTGKCRKTTTLRTDSTSRVSTPSRANSHFRTNLAKVSWQHPVRCQSLAMELLLKSIKCGKLGTRRANNLFRSSSLQCKPFQTSHHSILLKTSNLHRNLFQSRNLNLVQKRSRLQILFQPKTFLRILRSTFPWTLLQTSTLH